MRRAGVIAFVLAVLWILVFFAFGQPVYEELDIDGKKAFMMIFDIGFLLTMGYAVMQLLQGSDNMEGREQ